MKTIVNIISNKVFFGIFYLIILAFVFISMQKHLISNVIIIQGIFAGIIMGGLLYGFMYLVNKINFIPGTIITKFISSVFIILPIIFIVVLIIVSILVDTININNYNLLLALPIICLISSSFYNKYCF